MAFLLSAARTPLLRPATKYASSRFMSVTVLSDEDAVEKFRIINKKSVLYFTATWCPPCKMIAPIYEELSKEYTSVAFGKVDVDENDGAAMDFQIQAVPTFVLFEGEKAIEKFSGADKTQLENLVKDLDGR